MNLDAPLMRLRNHEFQRIKARILAQNAGEIGRPRQDRGLIKRIRRGRNLKDDRIDTKLLRAIQYGQKLAFLRDDPLSAIGNRRRLLRWPIKIDNRGNPCRMESITIGKHAISFHPGQKFKFKSGITAKKCIHFHWPESQISPKLFTHYFSEAPINRWIG